VIAYLKYPWIYALNSDGSIERIFWPFPLRWLRLVRRLTRQESAPL
jgi:hypothetical protein